MITTACGQCQVRQGARHDTWMTIVLETQRCAILSLTALEPRVFAWWNVIMLSNSVRAVFVGVLFTHPSVVWKFFSSQPKLVMTLRKIFTDGQTVKNAENSNFSSSNCFGPNLTTRTKLSASSTATLCRTSILFRDNRVVVVFVALKMLSFFAVLFVDCEERFFTLLGSLPGARHAIVCILCSLEQSRVVDWVVAEVLLYLTWESNASNFEFSQLLWRRRNVLLQGESVVQHYVVLSRPDGW